MNERDELNYGLGRQMMAREMLSTILHDLPEADKDVARHHLYLMEIRAQLRSVCEDFGDNDWDDNLHLGDVIDKHLTRHLYTLILSL